MKALGKRGEAEELETLTLFDVVLGIVVATFLVIAALSFSSISSFGRLYLEKDVSLLTSAVLSSPGQITLKYPIGEDYRVQMCEPETNICNHVKVVHDPTLLGVLKKDRLVFGSSPATDLSLEREE
ncbi:MAG TPA: hypothetical protein HA362_02255 [Nanoarchaeota archaeon]|nr:hypothetical protein [Nanoarchaeota archaeon]